MLYQKQIKALPISYGMKTKKALSKRVKITGSKKILKRRPHQNHFNAKESGNATRGKRSEKRVPKTLIKDVKALIGQY